ncbi:sulfotransferase family 2 domain-containing protein [Bauldia sp.]|uniref:sulfotransferase family 2 domain-containing protein n=1 Tax=Bauldia sp. TaxID=2575872 RepID=UPI003BA9EF55
MHVVKSDKLRLIYVTNPKAASSSIFKLMLALSGVQPNMPARKALRRDSFKAIARDAGVSRIKFSRKRARRFQKRHANYTFFTFVRDPYSRCVSNYYNKLNRVAKEYSRNDYYFAKAMQIASGPAAWSSHLRGIAFLKKRISFEDYVRLLREHGIDFSHHFGLQRTAISYNDLKFDFIGKVESFDYDIDVLLGNAGAARTNDDKPTRENVSSGKQDMNDLLTDDLKRAIYAMYQPDFETFGYDRSF